MPGWGGERTPATGHTVMLSSSEMGSYEELFNFLRATAGTATARLSHRNSVSLSVTRVDQAKKVQVRIIKSSPSAAPKTLVSGSVTLFQKFHRGQSLQSRALNERG